MTVEDVLSGRLGSLGIPVLAGIPAGHLEDNLELHLGAPARIDADRGELVMESAVQR